MPPFERGEGGLAPLLDLPQPPIVLEPETDSYPNVLVDTSCQDATLVLLAFERATHNVPEEFHIPPEQIQASREELHEDIDACLAANKGKVFTPAMRDSLFPIIKDKIDDGVDPYQTGGFICVPGFMEAAEDIAPETFEERKKRLRHEASVAEVPRLLSPECLEVVMLGLDNESRVGDRTAVNDNEIAASKVEAQYLKSALVNRMIGLPAGEDLILKITFPEIL